MNKTALNYYNLAFSRLHMVRIAVYGQLDTGRSSSISIRKREIVGDQIVALMHLIHTPISINKSGLRRSVASIHQLYIKCTSH